MGEDALDGDNNMFEDDFKDIIHEERRRANDRMPPEISRIHGEYLCLSEVMQQNLIPTVYNVVYRDV
jgi:hypothetical protein